MLRNFRNNNDSSWYWVLGVCGAFLGFVSTLALTIYMWSSLKFSNFKKSTFSCDGPQKSVYNIYLKFKQLLCKSQWWYMWYYLIIKSFQLNLSFLQKWLVGFLYGSETWHIPLLAMRDIYKCLSSASFEASLTHYCSPWPFDCFSHLFLYLMLDEPFSFCHFFMLILMCTYFCAIKFSILTWIFHTRLCGTWKL